MKVHYIHRSNVLNLKDDSIDQQSMLIDLVVKDLMLESKKWRSKTNYQFITLEKNDSDLLKPISLV